MKWLKNLFIYLYLRFLWPGKSRLEYCFDIELKSFSPRPEPPRAGSNVGRAAVVMFYVAFLRWNLFGKM